MIYAITFHIITIIMVLPLVHCTLPTNASHVQSPTDSLNWFALSTSGSDRASFSVLLLVKEATQHRERASFYVIVDQFAPQWDYATTGLDTVKGKGNGGRRRILEGMPIILKLLTGHLQIQRPIGGLCWPISLRWTNRINCNWYSRVFECVVHVF